jgi:predicted acetyltransferase
LAEFAAAGESRIPGYFVPAHWLHARIVDALAAWGRGEQLEPDWVPCSTRFLAVDDELVGLYSLRHRLSDQLRQYGGHIGYSVRPSARRRGYATILLRAGARQALELGISRLLVTCDPANAASIRVIERCGGVFSDESFSEALGRGVRRHWLPTQP